MSEMSALPGRMIYGCAWKKERTTSLVVSAVRAGFRSIDVAAQRKHYNQPGVGEALDILIQKDRLVRREDLFLQTKYTSPSGQNLAGPLPYDPKTSLVEQVRQSFETSLKELQTDYIDSLLLHGPERTAAKNVEALTALKPYIQSGKLKHIGISNIYDVAALRSINEALQEHRLNIRFVQNRFYAATGYDTDLRAYCHESGIAYQSFWTLTANPHILSSKPTKRAAHRLGITAEQAFYQYCIQEGITPLNGTTDGGRMKLGVSVLQGQAGDLTPAERTAIRQLLA